MHGSFDWKAKTPTMSVYSRDAITQVLGITRGGLILFALTAGGDYDKVTKQHDTVTLGVV